MKNIFQVIYIQKHPEAIDKLLSEFEDNEILKENARLMIEIAYKTGYVDAWKDALFFHK